MSDPGDRAEDRFGDKLTVPHRREASAPGIVGNLIVSPPVLGSATMTVRAAATVMTEHGQNYLVVPLADGSLGMLTDADIRARVVAGGHDFDMSVQAVATPVSAVAFDTPAVEALTTLLDSGLAVLPVRGADGGIVGAVSHADFVAAPAGAALAVRAQIAQAPTVADLQRHGRRVPGLFADLIRRDQPAHEASRVLSLMNDAIVRRALELTARAHPELDFAAISWLSLGSNARREPVLSSDVDSAVSVDDSMSESELDAFRAAFVELDDIIRGAALAIDTNGALASKPLFSRTHTQWRSAARGWIEDPLADKGMIFTSLILDGRPIWGAGVRGAAGQLLDDLRSHPQTMSLLLTETLSRRARLRSMRDVLTGRGGEFDVKADALTPLVNIARWAALSVQSVELDTRARLRAASGSAMLPEDQANTLIEVFDVLQRVRMRYQVAQFDRGEPVSDVLTMKRLSPLDRSLVAQAVREVAGVQRRMANLSHYLPVESDGGAN